jgi:NO-binding membrane sensor protein with MHYT domain
MLVFSLPIGVSYDVPTVLVSLMLAILASGVALRVVGGRTLTFPSLVLGGFVISAGTSRAATSKPASIR